VDPPLPGLALVAANDSVGAADVLVHQAADNIAPEVPEMRKLHLERTRRIERARLYRCKAGIARACFSKGASATMAASSET